jgi:gluconate kinase
MRHVIQRRWLNYIGYKASNEMERLLWIVSCNSLKQSSSDLLQGYV